MINAFLEYFYKTISFEGGEMFKSEQFRPLFCPDAILFEKTEDGFVQKTVF